MAGILEQTRDGTGAAAVEADDEDARRGDGRRPTA